MLLSGHDSHMTPRLTSKEVAKINGLLIAHAHEKGPRILGAQLGQYIRRAISPKTIKFIGNLRSLVDDELCEVLTFVQALPSDSLYSIAAADNSGGHFNTDHLPVTGAKLWENFSNPNVDCTIGVDASEVVYVAPPTKPFGPEITRINKMTSDEYLELAKRFAAEQTDPTLQAALVQALEHPIFYPKWIAVLRELRSTAANHLRAWEIQRTDLVVTRLQQELEDAGVSSAQAVIIANDIRPKSGRSVFKAAQSAALRAVNHPEAASVTSAVESKEHEDLRKVLHRAIDKMSFSDLKEIRVPAGLLLEIFQEQVD